MEEKLYFDPYHDEFHKVFPGYSPCDCHTEYEYTMYDVEVTIIPTVSGEKIAKEVTIQCQECGEKVTFDVESLEVYEQDLKFG